MVEWTDFLNKLLDGAYALDVRKIGSHAMVVRNKLGSEPNGNTESTNLRASLEALINSKEFTVSESLREAETYSILFDLGIEFIGGKDLLAKRCSALYLSLRAYTRNLNEQSLRCKEDLEIKSCLVIVKFIESWKKKAEILGETNIYKDHLFLETVSNQWKIEIEKAGLKNPLVVIGLVYLNEWDSIPRKRIANFFQQNKDNEELFGVILSDMLRVEGDTLFDYVSFTKSSEDTFERFYLAVKSRMPSWLGEDEKPDSEIAAERIQEKTDEKSMFQTYAKELAKAGFLDKQELAQTIADRIKDL